MEKQVKQHSEDVRKRENKVSHELKTKGNKVSTFRTLREGHNHEQKKSKEGREWREKRKGEKRRVCIKSGETPYIFLQNLMILNMHIFLICL